MTSDRRDVVSSFTLIKGALITETYAAFAGWDLGKTKSENLDRLREQNYIGASSVAWVRDVAKVINRRFDPDGRDRALVTLAKGGCILEEWRPLLLWHMTRDEFLLRDFLQNWLFSAFDKGVFRIKSDALLDFVSHVGTRGGQTEHAWSEETLHRVTAGLLKIACDFGLLRGTATKEFASFHLPERSFLYLLHAVRDQVRSPGKILTAADWRMYLMRPEEVEREILRLHQFRKLDYQVAGSLMQLSLPCASSHEYAERMVA